MAPTDLPWLPTPTPDFASQVRALRAPGGWTAKQMRALAMSALSLQQLSSLARAMPDDDALLPAEPLHLSVLSNATSDLLLPALVATAARHDLWLRVRAPAFGTHAQEALDPASDTNRQRPHAVLLALDHRAHDLSPCPGQAELAEQRVTQAVAQLAAMAAALQSASGATVVVQTLAPTGAAVFGHLEAQLPGTAGWLVDSFNRRLRSERAPGVLLLDMAALAADVGLGTWHDTRLWNLGKFPFSQQVVPLVADHVCRLLAAARGKSKKCLVLDLDNTLWGGVIGDDGMQGIALGQGSAAGEAHLAVQGAALALHDRGVVLAVSSKNEDAIARQVFREHPDMLLREQHIAAFQANWQDKASNLQAIAKALNIGVDALVLLDDNPAERQQVRMALPEVGVPELPDSPDDYAAILLAAGYFESTQFTDEDRARASQYQANAERSAMLDASTDLSSHLAALDMEAQITPFDEFGRARITQLINKTNQFNLTTRRMTEPEVARLETDPAALTLQVRLKDRFGDNGMIGVVIGRCEADSCTLETWLMSCRVLNRGVERLVLDVLAERARQRGIRRLVGIYLPTAKNALVREHYRQLGFQADASAPEGERWLLDLENHQSGLQRGEPSAIRLSASSLTFSPGG
jgi:FkbH-like protein